MKFGVVFPQTEFGHDPAALKEYTQTAEELGYHHILAYDHILGANPDRPGGWKGPYTHQTPFLEPFVLFGFMAGLTSKIGFATSIIILPQRQTALVAKQAATLDAICGGRTRLGVGLGWNPVEYEALNEDFRTRGRRMREQVELLRLLWTQPLVNFTGRWHTISDAGLNPLPVQQPIPLWFGGREEAALKRAAELADGWMTNAQKAEDAKSSWELIQRTLAEQGRAAESFGLEVRIPFGTGDPHVWETTLRGWEELGTTYASINTMGAGLKTAREHIEAIEKFAKGVGLN